MRNLPRLTHTACAALLAGGFACAQVAEGTTSKADVVRSLFASYDAMQKDYDQLVDERRSVKRNSDEEAALLERMKALRAGMRAPEQEFVTAFRDSSWKEFDPTKDKDLLLTGLTRTAGDTEHPDKALAACRLFLEHFSDERAASFVRTSRLPNALLACGEFAEAKAVVEAAIAGAEGPDKTRLQLLLGDFHAAAGDRGAATQVYAEAERDANERSLGRVKLRQDLLGKPAPDIDSKQWIGAEATSLAALRGHVVLIDFWATWCGPCRMVMPGLDALSQQHAGAGLRVMGVTRYYENGYLPADASQMQTGGESVRDIQREQFTAHVTAFRDNTGITYPFAVAEPQDFKNYSVSSIPTVVLVDRDGTVALVTTGAGSEPLLAYALKNLLSPKRAR